MVAFGSNILIACMGLLLTVPAQSREDLLRQPRDYALEKATANDLVFMGTTHHKPPILALIADLLPRLHSAGVTHLALEIAADQQTAVDRFMATGEGLADIVLHDAIDCPAYRRLLTILQQLPPRQRPRVLAIDLPYADYDGRTDRDAFMARQLIHSLQQDGEAKIFAVLGSLHVLRRLRWLPRITNGRETIRTHLGRWRPDLKMFSMAHIIASNTMQSDFFRLGQAEGAIALDLQKRYHDWNLGITDCLALRPSQPWELVEGVIVHGSGRSNASGPGRPPRFIPKVARLPKTKPLMGGPP